NRLAPSNLGPEGCIAQGTLADDMRRAGAGESVVGVESLEAWRATMEPGAPWTAPDLPRLGAADPRGWRSYRLLGTSEMTAGVRLVHTPRMQSLAWALLLATLGLGSWK